MPALTIQNLPNQNTVEPAAQPRQVRSRWLVAPLALAVYALMIAFVGMAKPERSTLFNATLPDQPDIAIAGSSVIATPLALIDSSERGYTRDTDTNRVRRVEYVENALSRQEIQSPQVWTVAMAGQNIEETNQFIDANFVGRKRPKVLALFIAPLFFVHKQNFDPGQELFEHVLSNVVHNFGVDCQRLSAFRLSIQLKLTLACSQTYMHLGLHEPHWRQLLKTQDSYARFYARELDKGRLDTLRQLIDQCTERGIEVVLVSTPLALENRALMHTWSYNNYHSRIEQIAKGRCPFVDLGEDARFVWPTDFDDSAHTNDVGGRKMLDEVTPLLATILQSARTTVGR